MSLASTAFAFHRDIASDLSKSNREMTSLSFVVVALTVVAVSWPRIYILGSLASMLISLTTVHRFAFQSLI